MLLHSHSDKCTLMVYVTLGQAYVFVHNNSWKSSATVVLSNSKCFTFPLWKVYLGCDSIQQLSCSFAVLGSSPASDLIHILSDCIMLCYRCVRLLCEYNTDIKVRVDEKEDNALHIAARSDHSEILQLLLSEGLDPELR